MNEEVERIWKEAVVAYFEAVFLERLWKSRNNFSEDT
jgi:hypothetical protein